MVESIEVEEISPRQHAGRKRRGWGHDHEDHGNVQDKRSFEEVWEPAESNAMELYGRILFLEYEEVN